jgi:hypothetical protein
LVYGNAIDTILLISTMSFNLAEFSHIVSTIDDLLSMSEPQCSINISTGYDEEKDEDEDEESDENEDLEFISLIFSLKNGQSQVRIYNSFGIFFYMDNNGEFLKSIDFDDTYVAETSGSFKKALKQIRDFDRKHISAAKSVAHTSIDRASFGLAEVN